MLTAAQHRSAAKAKIIDCLQQEGCAAEHILRNKTRQKVTPEVHQELLKELVTAGLVRELEPYKKNCGPWYELVNPSPSGSAGGTFLLHQEASNRSLPKGITPIG